VICKACDAEFNEGVSRKEYCDSCRRPSGRPTTAALRLVQAKADARMTFAEWKAEARKHPVLAALVTSGKTPMTPEILFQKRGDRRRN
jgi:hypothetical protein